MDAQTLCLGALCLGDASGYEIRKLYEDGPLSHLYAPSFGAIYPALAKLLERHYATVETQSQESRPDKKVYRITETGRAAFKAAIAAPKQPDMFRSEHLYALYFSPMLSRAEIAEVLHSYRRSLVEKSNLADVLSAVPDEAPLGQKLVGQLGELWFATAIAFCDDALADLESTQSGASAPERTGLDR